MPSVWEGTHGRESNQPRTQRQQKKMVTQSPENHDRLLPSSCITFPGNLSPCMRACTVGPYHGPYRGNNFPHRCCNERSGIGNVSFFPCFVPVSPASSSYRWVSPCAQPSPSPLECTHEHYQLRVPCPKLYSLPIRKR